MTMPHSMDYLMNAGVLDFDAAAYLNSNAGGVQYPSMLGGAKMQQQPQNDSFSSKLNAKLKDTNFLKKAATAVIVTTLAVFGFKKGKNLFNAAKNSSTGTAIANAYNSCKSGIANFITKFKK